MARESRWGEGSMWLLMKESHLGMLGEPLARASIKNALNYRPKKVQQRQSSYSVPSGEDVYSRLYSHHRKHGPARSVTDLKCLLGHRDPFQIPDDELEVFDCITTLPIDARSVRPAEPGPPRNVSPRSWAHGTRHTSPPKLCSGRPASACLQRPASSAAAQLPTRPSSAGVSESPHHMQTTAASRCRRQQLKPRPQSAAALLQPRPQPAVYRGRRLPPSRPHSAQRASMRALL